MLAQGSLDELGLSGAAFAAPVTGGRGVGFHEHDLVSPASVMKIQIALAVEDAIARGLLDPAERRRLSPERRTPGPVGISLMRDEVSMSVRDLVTAMLTVSDNVATDELIALVGLDQVNRVTAGLGMSYTRITSNLRDMLDAIAHELDFPDYEALAAEHFGAGAPPASDALRRRLASSGPLDPRRGTRTTAAETVTLLQGIWTDRAAAPAACATVRRAMGRQLTRDRIASGFEPPVRVAAKSGGLLDVVRNEAGVVTFPDGDAYAVAVYTRRRTVESPAPSPARINAVIGQAARLLVDRLRGA